MASELRIVAHAEIAQDDTALLVGGEGKPGAAERTRQDRAATMEGRCARTTSDFGRGRVSGS